MVSCEAAPLQLFSPSFQNHIASRNGGKVQRLFFVLSTLGIRKRIHRIRELGWAVHLAGVRKRRGSSIAGRAASGRCMPRPRPPRPITPPRTRRELMVEVFARHPDASRRDETESPL